MGMDHCGTVYYRSSRISYIDLHCRAHGAWG